MRPAMRWSDDSRFWVGSSTLVCCSYSPKERCICGINSRSEASRIFERARLIRHNNPDNRCRRAVLQKRVAGEQEFAHVFAGDDPSFGLIPIED